MQNYEIRDYGTKSPFASFLPGIAGLKGKPIWCYYVNRGQAVASFGTEHKDHAIMEFYPAHAAYQNVKRTGFRTFLKRADGSVAESFSREEIPHRMEIGMNTLTIEEENAEFGVRTRVTYFILPEEPMGALVREVELTNLTGEELSLEVLDGMPALIPYGVGQESIKTMTQLVKAWMQAEELESRVPFFRVRASMEDTASVTEVKGGNYALAVTEDGEKLPPIVDMNVIFGYDSSLERPVNFLHTPLEELLARRQNTSNLFPGCFFAQKVQLAPGAGTVFHEMIGQAENRAALEAYLGSRTWTGDFFVQKLRRAGELTEELTQRIAGHTGNATFDAYTQYTYMDNVLRGGQPVRIGKNHIFHVYSRKHGDLEREYNYFAMSPEYYSQGNGNFRDVNQNRREDNFFSPIVGRENIYMFYDLIQADGYNPLSVERRTYRFEDCGEAAADNLPRIPQDFADRSFTPGELLGVLEREGREEDFGPLMDRTTEDVGASFGEGYWSDHWTYNLDLVEEYLRIYPEQERDLLLEERYTYFPCEVRVNPRSRRYEKTENGIRQYNAITKNPAGKNADRRASLLEKMVLLCMTKFATLDPYFIGVEMEGGKAGWYDALNGLPGLLGSSVAETCELARMLDFVTDALERYELPLKVFAELGDFMEGLGDIIARHREELLSELPADHADVWNEMNDCKEAYRARIYEGFGTEERMVGTEKLYDLLRAMRGVLAAGLGRAEVLGAGLLPTYFYMEVTDYTEDADGIHPKSFRLQSVPAFLEGPVRYLKLRLPEDHRKRLYRKVRESDLYDHALRMYKVNAPLTGASYELGRCCCFTPGWLENESIWLHMEYKYLLELLKSGLYEEFAGDLIHAAIPFLDPEMYGRSILENSSFLVSSSNPDPSIHGKGFVARLSGSTVEFLSIWKRMMFGNQPIRMKDGEPEIHLTPLIPEQLIGDDLEIRARFMDRVEVVYRLAEKKTYLPGQYDSTMMTLIREDGIEEKVCGCLRGDRARDFRDGKYKKVFIALA